MLGILEHHVDRLVFEDDLAECDEIPVVQFSIQLCGLAGVPAPFSTQGRPHHDLSRPALADAGVRLLVALLVGLELFDRKDVALLGWQVAGPHAQLGVVERVVGDARRLAGHGAARRLRRRQ